MGLANGTSLSTPTTSGVSLARTLPEPDVRICSASKAASCVIRITLTSAGLVPVTAHFPKVIYLLAFDRAKVAPSTRQICGVLVAQFASWTLAPVDSAARNATRYQAACGYQCSFVRLLRGGCHAAASYASPVAELDPPG